MASAGDFPTHITTHTNTHTHTHTYARTRTHAHLHTCTHAHTHTRTHAHKYAHTNTRTRTRTRSWRIAWSVLSMSLNTSNHTEITPGEVHARLSIFILVYILPGVWYCCVDVKSLNLEGAQIQTKHVGISARVATIVIPTLHLGLSCLHPKVNRRLRLQR